MLQETFNKFDKNSDEKLDFEEFQSMGDHLWNYYEKLLTEDEKKQFKLLLETASTSDLDIKRDLKQTKRILIDAYIKELFE